MKGNARGKYSFFGTDDVMTARFELQDICLTIFAILKLKLVFFAFFEEMCG